MWFGKLFGRRHDDDDDEQPTAVAPPPRREPTVDAKPVAKPAKRRQTDGQRKGFDPYNSGAFTRHVWERVNRD